METICVFKAETHQEAMCVKAILESNDIIVFMPNEHLSGIMPHWSLATGGLSIFVPHFQFVLAAEVLTALSFRVENKKLIDNFEEKEKTKEFSICPKCGNNSVETKIITRKWLVCLLFILFHVPITAKKVEKFCHSCGQKIK